MIEDKIKDATLDNIMEGIIKSYNEVIYVIKKQCIGREPIETDEQRFSLIPSASTFPKMKVIFDGKPIGYIEQKHEDMFDFADNKFKIIIEFNPL